MTVNISSVAGASLTWATDGSTWESAPYTWDTAYATTWSLTATEGWATTEKEFSASNFVFAEEWNIAELRFANAIKPLLDRWNTSETVTHTWQDFLRVLEGWTVGEVVSKNFIPAPWTDGWKNLDFEQNSVTKNEFEGLATSDFITKAPISAHNEAWNTAESANKAVAKNLAESWATAENTANFFTKVNLEATRFIELWSDLTNYHLNVTAGWATTESEKQSFVKAHFVEEWTTLDNNSRGFVKAVVEAWAGSETFAEVWNSQKIINDLWHTADSLEENYGLNELEALQTIGAYLRNANAVISDLAFASGDLSVAEFLNMNSPVGYSPFTEFIPGELEYQKALLAIVIAGPLTTGRPQITDWQLTVDVPNQTDSGTLTLPAANTFVPFNVRFYASPQVMVQLRGGSTGTPDITNITENGFYVEIDNATDQPIVGDIVWSADGY
jgi:hypothetical protein